MTLFREFAFVGLGSMLGGMLRHAVSLVIVYLGYSGSFPLANLVVNLLGSFFFGLIYGWLSAEGGALLWRLLLLVGLCGGFTTFSSFSYEGFALLNGGRLWLNLAFLSSSVLGGYLLLYLGLLLGRTL